MNVLVTSTVLLNMGDAAILEGLVETLKRAYGDSVHVRAHDMDPKASVKYYPGTDVGPMLYDEVFVGRAPLQRALRFARLPKRWVKLSNERRMWAGARLLRRHSLAAKWILTGAEYQALTDFRDADLIVSTGGTYLVENYFLEPRILDYQVALFFDKPLIFFTQSLGPFHKDKYKKALRPVFDKAALILLRDERSRQHLLDIGVDSDRLHVVPDSAFALADPSAWKESVSTSDREADPPRVMISVRDWQHFKRKDSEAGMRDYVEAVRKAVTRLVSEDGAEVIFLSTCQGVPEYRRDDSELATEMAAGLSTEVQKRVTVDRDFHTPEQYQHAASDCDIVIATRMHAAILSLGAGVPVVPIEYEFKTRELFRKAGLVDVVQDIEDVDGDQLVAEVRKMLSDKKSMSSAFRAFVGNEFEETSKVSGLIRSASSR